MIEIADDRGTALCLTRSAQRVVSLVPSLTELLFSVGAGARVIGVTRYCIEPAAAVAACSKVGGTKNPDIAAIVALQPDLVIANSEENRRPDVEALIAANIRVFVSDVRRVAEVPSLMRRLAELVDAAARGEDLAMALETALARCAAAPVRRRVFCPIWKNPWMAFNADTYADDMLRIVGADNVCAGLEARYPVVDLEQIAALQPEVILLPDEPYVFGPKDLSALTPLERTPAMRSGRVRFMDGKALTWYGPRSAAALRYCESLLD